MHGAPRVVCLLGASGFVGRHVLAADPVPEGGLVHALSRHPDRLAQGEGRARLRTFYGDLRRPEMDEGFVVPGAVVVNLAYLKGDDRKENIRAADHLVDRCIAGGARRLVHCSTAVVAGAVRQQTVDEQTDCRPVTAYERCKLAVEERLRERCEGRLDLGLVRPTAVFGAGGRNLLTTVDFVTRGRPFYKRLRLSVFDTRRMNLVSVENTVAAIGFLVRRQRPLDGRSFIVSEDDHPENTFGAVCRRLHAALGIPFPRTLPVPFKRAWQRRLLARTHGPSVVPDRCYAGRSLAAAGFHRPFEFGERLQAYAEGCRAEAGRAR